MAEYAHDVAALMDAPGGWAGDGCRRFGGLRTRLAIPYVLGLIGYVVAVGSLKYVKAIANIEAPLDVWM